MLLNLYIVALGFTLGSLVPHIILLLLISKAAARRRGYIKDGPSVS